MSSADAGARSLGWAARLPLIAPLAGRDFRLVWLGESVSLLGDQFNTVALAWLVLGMTGSGFALGAILVASADPARRLHARRRRPVRPDLATGPRPRVERPASRADRPWSPVSCSAHQVQIWHLAVVGIAFGTVDAVFLPAINTLVPRLVPPHRLAAADAVMQGTGQLVGTIRAGCRRLRGRPWRSGRPWSLTQHRCRFFRHGALVRPLRGRARAGPTTRACPGRTSRRRPRPRSGRRSSMACGPSWAIR